MKRGSFLILLFFLVLLPLQFSFISAATNDTEQTKINKAYSCLQGKTNTSEKCSSLSTEEKIFSVLAINQCKAELISDSANLGECWPSSNCKIKPTAQAILALNKAKSSTTKAQEWLYSKNATPTELSWYLEIDSSEAATCMINYAGSSYTVEIGEDKKINSGAGSCLFPDPNGYWLSISPSCYNLEFTISCDKNFLTTTLFRKSTSSTIYVSEKTSSASAGGTTKEIVNSRCFSDSGLCTYEGTLWASLALNSVGKDVSAYLPYLITLADDNQRYLPSAFLYSLTGKTDYKISLLSKQKNNQYWQESGDKYYDTALALYPLQAETSTLQEKINAKNWLLSSQDPNGCWENNIVNTGFILASVWPKTFIKDTGEPALPDCESSGKYCVSSSAICTTSGGDVLDGYDCPGISQKCCSVQAKLQTCSEVGGVICSSNEECIGGIKISASDLRSAEICCSAGGVCKVKTEAKSVCEDKGGICRKDCLSDEEESSYSCNSLSQTCCMPKSTKKGPPTKGNTLWIWILVILIVLVIIGIIFRNKLRMFWFRMRSGKSKAGGAGHPPSTMPPYFPQYPQRPTPRMERRIIIPQNPPAQRPVQVTKIKSGAQKELDEVLKKLKEMGK